MTTPATVQFVLNIPTSLVPVVTESLCKAGGFQDITDANAKQAVINWITATVQNVQTQQVPPPEPPAPITGLT